MKGTCPFGQVFFMLLCGSFDDYQLKTERISLQPGETRTVRFTLCADKFQYFDGEGNICIDPGLFDIMVGPNSRDVRTAIFNLVGTNTVF